MGAALIVGAFLARAKKDGLHGMCQASVLLLNLSMIALAIWASSKRSHPNGAGVLPSPERVCLLPPPAVCAKTRAGDKTANLGNNRQMEVVAVTLNSWGER